MDGNKVYIPFAGIFNIRNIFKFQEMQGMTVAAFETNKLLQFSIKSLIYMSNWNPFNLYAFRFFVSYFLFYSFVRTDLGETL